MNKKEGADELRMRKQRIAYRMTISLFNMIFHSKQWWFMFLSGVSVFLLFALVDSLLGFIGISILGAFASVVGLYIFRGNLLGMKWLEKYWMLVVAVAIIGPSVAYGVGLNPLSLFITMLLLVFLAEGLFFIKLLVFLFRMGE